MVKKNEDVARLLSKMREEISILAPAHPETLGEVRIELEHLIRDIPEAMSDLFKLLRLCVQGIQAISEDTASEPPETLNALLESLAAAESYLTGHPDKAGLIREAGQLLDDQLTQKDDSRALSASEDVKASLNDAAAFLLQIEPDDFDELDHLRDLLAPLSSDSDCPEPVRRAVSDAVQKLRETAHNDQLTEDREVIIDEIGQLIEAAMVAAELTEHPATAPARSDEAAGANAPDYMPEDADLELIGEFITESGDLIISAEEALLSMESNPDDTEAVSTVFRAFHNIKGTSAFFELSLMTELAHYAESVLSRVREHEIRYAGGYPDLALRSVDMLKELFRLLQEALAGNPFTKPAGYDDLMRLLADPEKAGISDAGDPMSETEPDAPPAIGPLSEATEAASAEVPEKPEPTVSPAPEEKKQETPPPPSGTAPKKASAQHSRQVVESSIRVPIKRLDRFIDMVGELVVSHSMVAQDRGVAGGENHELAKKVAHTTKIVRELQSMSMSMRMIPLKMTFRKMARLVRDLSRKIGKDVHFITEGEDTEIDRNMVDIINDPLVHMVRNALDHGIELPDQREAMGKPRFGTIHLSAYHSAGNVVVEIRDDGRGLDRAEILRNASERHLIEDGSSMSDREVCNLIFEPGFSTAKIVSDVSGRGVGMDVVKKNIEVIRGHVEIQSDPGQGSIFKMSLPLTLAIIDGMVVRVGKEKYVVPTISIVRSVQPTRKDLSTVMRQGEVLNLQGRLIPLFRLADLFTIQDAETDLMRSIAVIVENDGHQAGLLVDELIGSQQIVIKTLGETLGNIAGISGSAIMPDGKVGLILDIGGLVRLANQT